MNIYAHVLLNLLNELRKSEVKIYTDQTNHFADVFVRENVAHGYDVRKFTADAVFV